LPSLAEMLQQRLAAELSEHVNGVDSGIDEIAENEIDDAVLASEGNGRLGAFAGERKEAGSFAAGEHNAQYPKLCGLHGEGGFCCGKNILRQSDLPITCVLAMLSEDGDGLSGCISFI